MPKIKHSSHNISFVFSGRTSAPVCKKGSITIEAAVAIPLFFLAVVSLLYLMEIMAVRTAVRSGLQAAGKELAQEAYVVTTVIPSGLEKDIVEAIGSERLDRSIVEGGSNGIHCESSYMSSATGIGELHAKYKVRIPLPVFYIPAITYEESIRIKAWTGYEKSLFGSQDEEIVYVTETGIVYHKDYHCTHLELSIRMVSASDIHTLRNEDGGKYYPCEHCGSSSSGGVYITGSGDRYHSSLSCSGLKRTVYAVPLSEVIGKGACSRCSSSGK